MKSYSHFFSKNICETNIVLTRTVNILTTNKLVKLTMLWTTGPRLACVFMQSNLSILRLSTYTTLFIDSISGKRRPWSACANAQADLGLRCPQIAFRCFSCIAHHIFTGKYCLIYQVTYSSILIPAVAPRNTGVALCLSEGILSLASSRQTSRGTDKSDGCSA